MCAGQTHGVAGGGDRARQNCRASAPLVEDIVSGQATRPPYKHRAGLQLFSFQFSASSFLLLFVQVRSVEAIVRALNEAKVQYLIVGGLAVNAHGYERLTIDLDVVIGLDSDNIIRGLRALEAIDYHMAIPVSPEQFADPALREQCIHPRTFRFSARIPGGTVAYDI